MLIAIEGRPAVMAPIFESDGDAVLWSHCFGDAVTLDTKQNRATVAHILQAHNSSADFCQPLKKRSK